MLNWSMFNSIMYWGLIFNQRYNLLFIIILNRSTFHQYHNLLEVISTNQSKKPAILIKIKIRVIFME